MNKIVLITNKFPFESDTGEIYLNEEIKELSKAFQSVVVIACDIKNSKKTITKLPENVQAISIGNSLDMGIARYFKYTIFGFFYKKNEDFRNEIKSKKLTFAQRLFLTYFYGKSFHRAKKICELKRFISDADCLYAYRLFDINYATILAAKKIESKAKIVARAHRFDLYEDKNSLNYLPLRDALLKGNTRIFPCSMDGVNYMKWKYPIYDEKIMCSRLGSREICNAVNQSPEESFQLISCSTLDSVKRVEKIADVVVSLSKEMLIHWTHIGGGNQIDKYKEKYKEMINAGVIEFRGSLAHDDVINCYRTSHFDLFINLSTSEGIPQAIMEALSCGIPVLATDVGGVSEILTDNFNGFLINVNTDNGTIKSIILDYRNCSLSQIRQFRKQARITWEEEYNSENNSRKFIDDISNLCIAKVKS